MSPTFDQRAVWLAREVLPHEPALRAWLTTRRLAGMQIDDVVQEAYSRLISADAVDQIRNVRGYFFQTARSVIATHVRSARVVEIFAVSDLDSFGVAASEPTAEDFACDREELRRLAKVIAALGEPTRTIFCLRRIDGMPQREISQTLGIPESTVEKHISRGLLAISKLVIRGGSDRADASRQAGRKSLTPHAKRKRAGH